LSLPHPRSSFDFAISIAVIHHLSSTARRVEAIKAILETLKSRTNKSRGGQALLFVWALEQKNSRRGWGQGDQQDVLVPWVLKPDHNHKSGTNEATTYQRYYHLYQEGEIQNDVRAAGASVVKSGYDRDNWWVVMERQD
jgi:tRNA (uracil-5-)-methyltransferase TRM9